MDNTHLLNQLKREGRRADHPLMMYWFRYGLLLAVMGLMQEQKRRENRLQSKKISEPDYGERSENGANDDSPKAIEAASSGLAAVIVPIIRRLARGPDE